MRVVTDNYKGNKKMNEPHNNITKIEKEPRDNSEKSELGITAKKADDFSEWYTQVIRKAELIEYGPVSGCMVIRPYAYSIWEAAQSFLDKEFKKMGVQNAYFPLLIPESLLKKEQEHVEGFTPEVAWVTEHGDTKFEERLAIRPTSETIMYDSYTKWIRSYKDLPLRINQWCNIVRWEFKHPVPFLRTREFLWQEGHTVFATKEEADAEVSDILNLYARAFEELYAVPVLKGKKTDSEKFAGADYTVTVEALMPTGKGVQAASAHLLGQNFSKPFNISFLDKDGERKFGWQNSWGFTTRSIGVMISVHGDDKGLIIPPRIAPTQIVIVPIVFSNKPAMNETVMKLCEQIRGELVHNNFRVILDKEDGSSPGYKFNYWEMKGVPLRIEIGPKDVEKGSVVFVRRDNGLKESVPASDVGVRAIKILADVQDSLFERASKYLHDHIVKTISLAEIKKAVETGNIALSPWCGEHACESKVKELTGAKSLNMPLDQASCGHKGECFSCGKKAEHWVYFAKSY